MRRRDQAFLDAKAEQRRREDAAPRLSALVPNLRTLRLTLEDVSGENRTLAQRYAKLIVVDSAPAMFEIPCMEPRCDGVHELTPFILQGLRQSLTSFSGRSECNGRIANVACDRVLAYACEASYADTEPDRKT